MAQIKGLSDFVLTGCAILPAMGLAFGRPEFALLSHIVLLFGGILIAGTEDDAPFKRAVRDETDTTERSAPGRSVPQHALGASQPSQLLRPLHRDAAEVDPPSHRPASGRKVE